MVTKYQLFIDFLKVLKTQVQTSWNEYKQKLQAKKNLERIVKKNARR